MVEIHLRFFHLHYQRVNMLHNVLGLPFLVDLPDKSIQPVNPDPHVHYVTHHFSHLVNNLPRDSHQSIYL